MNPTEEQTRQEKQRGRRARVPYRIQLIGWWDIARRLFKSIGEQNMSILAAGVAFYALLAIFPALAAMVTIYALLSDPQTVADHVTRAQVFLPADVVKFFNEQLRTLSAQPVEGLSLNLVSGILFAIWSAHKGVDALVRAIGVAYHEPETRGLVRLNLLTYLLTFAAIMFVVIVLILMVVLPSVTALLTLPAWWDTFVPIVRWLVFIGVVSLAIATLYRYAPARRPAKWRWLSTGAVVATILWVIGSALFSYYVSQFGTYNETYGALGAIIVLLLWFYISSYAVIVGAALNAETEHQTLRDTTTGKAKPMGKRGAIVADTIGAIPSSD
ncbi:MAG: YihY/virulence factor BrkB family protein [Granulosicoccus sp.]|nr:YihY/virulence factor BrkB family protein [Granulosicoccus sp.]